jgi:hypothetical protein
MLWVPAESVAFQLQPKRLAFIEQKMREMGIESREALAEAAKLSPDVIQKKLFPGRNIDRSTVEAIAKTLKIQPTEISRAREVVSTF